MLKAVCLIHFKPRLSNFLLGGGAYKRVLWINTGGYRNKKHKKQPFGDASASHLSLVLWYV